MHYNIERVKGCWTTLVVLFDSRRIFEINVYEKDKKRSLDTVPIIWCSNNECFDFWESKEPFICLMWIMFSFSTCLGYRWIPKKRPVSLFCWKLLRLLFILLWCCQQRWTALFKAIYLFHHIQLIINILITLVLKYTICTVWVCSSVNIN